MTPENADRPQIFISYSHKDASWARSFAKALSKRGLEVWFDEFRVKAGESLRDALESGLRSSDVFVTLIDAEHPNKPNLFFELGAAIGMGKRVVAIVPKDFPAAALPTELRFRKYLTRDTPEETAQELTQSLTAA
jgi:hypothetical protein